MNISIGNLPNIFQVAGYRAEDKSKHQDACDLGSYFDAGDGSSRGVICLHGSAADDKEDGEVKGNHHPQQHQLRQAEHENEVQKLLEITM